MTSVLDGAAMAKTKTQVLPWQRRGFSISQLRAMARNTLPRPIFDFADGGAEDEQTLRRNEAAFAALQLVPRPLEGAAHRDLSVSLFGKRLSLPVVIGPTGLAGLFWPDGECAAARAAQRSGTAYCLSHGSVCSLEKLAGTGASPRWMQVFIYKDRGFTRELAERAAAAGFDALVLTIDNQLLGNRERDLRNGFAIPPRFGLSEMVGMATKFPWFIRMRHELPKITFGNYLRDGESQNLRELAGRMADLLDPALCWRDLEWLRQVWKGPLLVKGVLHPSDAAAAVDRGVDGIIVSNHGGRQLDGAVTGAEALPNVVDAVAGRAAVLVDGGIRRGADVVKALALGAQCTLIARPQLFGLSVAGEDGVCHVLDVYRREIDRVMGLCGISRLDDIGKDLLFSNRIENGVVQS
jgi:isopentenyl diphosphate isomerase/L-lactate dehydrogenase-like FMN-dependent dehydrogenase